MCKKQKLLCKHLQGPNYQRQSYLWKYIGVIQPKKRGQNTTGSSKEGSDKAVMIADCSVKETEITRQVYSIKSKKKKILVYTIK